MKIKLGVLLFVSFCLSGCATTDKTTLSLLTNRLANLESNVEQLTGKTENTKQSTKPSIDKKTDVELQKSIKNLTDICVQLQKDVKTIGEAVEKERLVRIAIEKEKNPSDYKKYLEMRQIFE